MLVVGFGRSENRAVPRSPRALSPARSARILRTVHGVDWASGEGETKSWRIFWLEVKQVCQTSEVRKIEKYFVLVRPDAYLDPVV
jgi:hypothetical protein